MNTYKCLYQICILNIIIGFILQNNYNEYINCGIKCINYSFNLLKFYEQKNSNEELSLKMELNQAAIEIKKIVAFYESELKVSSVKLFLFGGVLSSHPGT